MNKIITALCAIDYNITSPLDVHQVPGEIRVADRTIVNSGGTFRLQESNVRDVTLYTGKEPAVIAYYAPGTLARSGFLAQG